MPDSHEPDPSHELQRGRELCERGAWGDAFESLSRADRTTPLGPEDLERLATAAYLIGRDDDFTATLDRAYQGYLEAGEVEAAARCGFWSGFDLQARGETARATGWLGRSRRLVEDRDCVERGYLLLPVVEERLETGDPEAAREVVDRIVTIADRFEDPDLVACARHLEGRVLMDLGRVPDGLALLDEAMVAVASGELSPIMTGLIYCSVIATCQRFYELDRAREWTAALARWCERQPQMVAFSATCLVHRAEVLCLQGAWPDAIEEAHRARERHAHGGGDRPLGAALYQQAEVHRLRGEFREAEEAFRGASRGGRDPQPGLALLRLAQGRVDAADAAIRSALGATRDPLRRAELLSAGIEIDLAADDVADARTALDELEEIADRYESRVLDAMAAQGRGAIDLAEGEAETALAALRHAWRVWRGVEAPHLAARVRVLTGLACRALGDEEGCALEFDAARAAFERLGAAPDLERVEALAGARTERRADPLTPRQTEVLRLVATGKTNRAIAEELFLSQRTVERHVSDILSRLNVSSRAAATAWAYEHDLI